MEASGIGPGQRPSRISMEIADPASTRLDFDSIAPSSSIWIRGLQRRRRTYAQLGIGASARTAEQRPLTMSLVKLLS